MGPALVLVVGATLRENCLDRRPVARLEFRMRLNLNKKFPRLRGHKRYPFQPSPKQLKFQLSRMWLQRSRR